MTRGTAYSCIVLIAVTFGVQRMTSTSFYLPMVMKVKVLYHLDEHFNTKKLGERIITAAMDKTFID